MASVELKAISKRYGAVDVIRSLDLSVEDGSFCALLGPSGCGKSTLLRMIAGLESVSGGTVRIGDRDVTYAEPKTRGAAMVFQSYALYPHLTVEQNICFSLSLAGAARSVQREQAARVAKMLQLEPLLDRRPAQLSGGQRQRVAIGRALVRDPEVFLFDEPLSNLDALLRVQMRLELAKLHNDLKTTMIYVTHDQVEAMTLADKIVVLDQGVIAQAGSPLDLYNNPANRFVASFIGSPAMSFLPADARRTADGVAVTVGDRTIAVGPRAAPAFDGARRVELGIRPEHIRLADQADADLQGRVSVVEQLGNMTYLYVDTPVGPVVAEADQALRIAPGTAVGLQVDRMKLHVFDEAGMAWPAVPVGAKT
jgi:ABC-type sugar transport system ATPase subunit